MEIGQLKSKNDASKLISQPLLLSSISSNHFSEANGEEVDLTDFMKIKIKDNENLDNEDKSKTPVVKIPESAGRKLGKKKVGFRSKVKSFISKSSRNRKCRFRVEEPEFASIHEDHVAIETQNARMDFRDVSKCGDQAVGWKSETLVDTVPEMLGFNCNNRDVTAPASMISTVTGTDITENLSEVRVTDSVREDDSAEGHFEFRPVDVTIQLKYLSGISQTETRNKISLRNSPLDHVNDKIGREDETVRAVVIYRKNTIASDKFISTNVPSLPLMVENAKDKSSLQVYAKWPSKVTCYDDNLTSMSSTGTQCFNPSSFTLNRTVRMVTFAGQQKSDGRESAYSSDKTACEAHTNGMNRKHNEDQANFLSAISQAFAPELVDLQVGLVKGAKEIIPIGVATVVVSGEFETLDLNIPVLRDYYGERFDARKKRTGFLSSIAGSSKKDFISFSSDKETKYKLTDGAFLRLELKVEPTSHAVGTPTSEYAAKGLDVINRKTDFRSGPINKAIKSRRKVERLMSLEKLSLQQRLRLYFELRKAPGSYDLPENPSNQANDNENIFSIETLGVCLGSQSNSSNSSSSFSHQSSSRYDADTDDDSEFIPPHFGAPSRVAPLSEVLAHHGRTNAHSENNDEISSFYSSLRSVLDATHPQRTSAIDLLKKFIACDPSFVLSDNKIDTLKYYAKDCRNVEEDSFSEAYTSGSDTSSYVPSRR